MKKVKIQFGTDGWRAIIAREYTVDNVHRVAAGTARWMQENGKTSVVVGYDCRFGGRMFAEETIKVLGHHNLKVYFDKNFVSTPMVSLGIVKKKAGLGVVITASHNPPDYNGYKLKAEYGGPSIPSEVAEVEDLIPDEYEGGLASLEEMEANGMLEYVDLEDMYVKHVRKNFDLEAINKANVKMAYDAMYGAGQNVIKRLFPDSVFLHCEYNPSFMGQAPEPIDRNLQELSKIVAEDESIDFGLANDGDADRIGMYDADGNFVDSHRLLLLLLYYLVEYKNLDGKVAFSFSVTDKLAKLARQYGLEVEVTKIGFKYIAELMSEEDILLGGEESGGIAVKGHIPERDGIWTGLLIMEFMAKTNKSLQELLSEVYEKVGRFDFYRDDLHLKQELKDNIVQRCDTDHYHSFGEFEVRNVETIDGYKYILGEDSWVMIRPSGTEPVLRVYGQAENMEEVRSRLDAVRDTLMNG